MSSSSSSSSISLGSVVSDSSDDVPMAEGGLTRPQVEYAESKVVPQPGLLMRAWQWVHSQQDRLDPTKYRVFLRMLREITCKNCLFFNVAELLGYESDLLEEFTKYLR